jgi:hypothetical protein
VVYVTISTENFVSDEREEILPIPVRVLSDRQEVWKEAPNYGGCSYFVVPLLGSGSSTPVQVLQRRPVREQAWLRNHDAGNYVVISQQPQNLQQQVPQGFIIQPGAVERIESQQPYWAVVMPDGTGLPGIVTSAPVPAQPAVPATGVAQQNINQFPVKVVIAANGATITAVVVNGVTVGTGAGTYTVPANGAISISYTVATPTWIWSNANTVVPAAVVVSVRDEAWTVREKGHDG